MIKLHARYDRRADVMYLFTDRNGVAHAQETPEGIVWRYLDADDVLVGATIIDFEEIWSTRFSELVGRLADRFHVPPPSAARVLEAARA